MPRVEVSESVAGEAEVPVDVCNLLTELSSFDPLRGRERRGQALARTLELPRLAQSLALGQRLPLDGGGLARRLRLGGGDEVQGRGGDGPRGRRDEHGQRQALLHFETQVGRVPTPRVVVLAQELQVARVLDAQEEIELRARPEVQGAVELDLVLDELRGAAALDQRLVLGRQLQLVHLVEGRGREGRSFLNQDQRQEDQEGLHEDRILGESPWDSSRNLRSAPAPQSGSPVNTQPAQWAGGSPSSRRAFFASHRASALPMPSSQRFE